MNKVRKGEVRASANNTWNFDSAMVVEKAVKGMLPKNKLGAELFRNLNVYVGSEHKHAAQSPKTVNLNDLK